MQLAPINLGQPSAVTIKVHASFLVVMLLFVGLFLASSARSDVAMLAACLAAVLVSLLLHELAHAMVARRYGVPLVRVDVHGFGSVTRFGARPIGLWRDVSLAYVGPVSSLALAVACGGLLVPLLEPHMIKSGCEVIQDGYYPLGITGNALTVALYVNLGLALINLLPAAIFDAGWMTYAQLRRRAGWRGASVVITLVTTAQAAAALALLGTALIVGIPGSFAIS